jgi:DnaJ-class molecular chaperone
MDYYKILNCSNATDQNGIKKMYRKMALKYHPDKNPNDENAKKKFEEIQEAYEVLSDEKKRKIYDKFGYKGLKEYEENDFGNQQHHEKEQTVKHIDYTIQELYELKSKEIKFKYKKQCMNCLGSGAIEKSDCEFCNGNGVTMKIHRMGPFIQQIQEKCEHCDGKGYKIIKECSICNGNGYLRELKYIKFELDGSSYDKVFKVYEDEGHEDNNGVKSDLVIVMKEKIDDRFKRRGFDLHIKEKIHLHDSLVGLKRTIDFIDGRKLFINEDTIIKDNDVRRIKNYGLKKNDGTYGDLIIEYNIIYPEELLDEGILSQLCLISENKEKDDESIEVDCIDFDNNIDKIDDNSPFGIHINSDGFEGIHGGMPEMHSVQQCAQS